MGTSCSDYWAKAQFHQECNYLSPRHSLCFKNRRKKLIIAGLYMEPETQGPFPEFHLPFFLGF